VRNERVSSSSKDNLTTTILEDVEISPPKKSSQKAVLGVSYRRKRCSQLSSPEASRPCLLFIGSQIAAPMKWTLNRKTGTGHITIVLTGNFLAEPHTRRSEWKDATGSVVFLAIADGTPIRIKGDDPVPDGKRALPGENANWGPERTVRWGKQDLAAELCW
jgi:hypothetical protein